jgi:hypothetical protein
MAGLDQEGCEAGAHLAQADKSDLHVVLSFCAWRRR